MNIVFLSDHNYKIELMKYLVLFALVSMLYSCSSEVPLGQVDEEITIYRDQWGVPHIHAPTDEEVAYGLAWASCEDDFVTIQEQMLAIQGKLGELKGKEGITIDMAIKFMGIREVAEQEYMTITPKVRGVIESYTAGVNAYAALHPEEVLLTDGFPVSKYDAAAGYMLGLVEISGAGEDLKKIMDVSIVDDEDANFPKGSNAIAIANSRTATDETFLAINSHQPLEGWYSWYEAHLISDEGLNILGGTFPGGATVFHGTNEHLGWAMTVNHADFSDVYKLEMDPDRSDYYKVDGAYKQLEKKTYKSWLKLLGPVKIPISRTVYKSDFGITFKTDAGYYAWRYVAGEAVRAIDQWYAMNRAQSWEQWRASLDMQMIPCTNIVYADGEDNIYYLSNGKIPKRDEGYDWRKVLPGDNGGLQWDEGYWSVDSLPQVLNPASGYVFNTNNSAFVSSGELDNPIYESRYQTMGFKSPELNNNRSTRFLELIGGDTSLTYEEFKTIKYDRQYPSKLTQPHMINQELILHLNVDDYPQLEKEIELINNWNRRTDADNQEALLVLLSIDQLNNVLREQGVREWNNHITSDQAAEAITRGRDIMMKKYGTIKKPLGEVQRHIRGEVDLPTGGGSDVLAAIHSKPIEGGKYHAYSGESYIQLVRFSKDRLPVIESINAYGSSAEPDSKHYTDQMELYVNQELKPMTLSLDEVKADAISIEHPMRVNR